LVGLAGGDGAGMVDIWAFELSRWRDGRCGVAILGDC